jgi:hypothetical protein
MQIGRDRGGIGGGWIGICRDVKGCVGMVVW